MKFCLRHAAVAALAVALSLPLAAAPSPQKERSRDKDEIVRIIKKIQRLIGISTNDDLPLPPPPNSNP